MKHKIMKYEDEMQKNKRQNKKRSVKQTKE